MDQLLLFLDQQLDFLSQLFFLLFASLCLFEYGLKVMGIPILLEFVIGLTLTYGFLIRMEIRSRVLSGHWSKVFLKMMTIGFNVVKRADRHFVYRIISTKFDSVPVDALILSLIPIFIFINLKTLFLNGLSFSLIKHLFLAVIELL